MRLLEWETVARALPTHRSIPHHLVPHRQTNEAHVLAAFVGAVVVLVHGRTLE